VVDALAAARSEGEAAVRVNPDVDALTHPYVSTGLRENKFGVDIGKWRLCTSGRGSWSTSRWRA